MRAGKQLPRHYFPVRQKDGDRCFRIPGLPVMAFSYRAAARSIRSTDAIGSFSQYKRPLLILLLGNIFFIAMFFSFRITECA